MELSHATAQDFAKYYTTAINALCEIARSYFYLGNFRDAQHTLHTALQLTEAREVLQRDHLKLLLLYGRILAIGHLVSLSDADLMFSTLQQAKQLAEAEPDQQSLADALSLLGQAHYFADLAEVMGRTGSPSSPQSEGKFTEALAYQQQALELREALHDTRGISESQFLIGIVYERWQQFEVALEHYAEARRIAEQYNHVEEKAEPSRHLAFRALITGDLEQALIYALEALSFRESAGFKPYQPFDHFLLSNVYQTKGDTANAQLHIQRALALAEEMGLQEVPAFVGARERVARLVNSQRKDV